ncbi:MAG: DUF4279 domain-containing protein [Firmicutes bacterium]|nr:DUF4279 domain-containing protein [Bacillota bacterium]
MSEPRSKTLESHVYLRLMGDECSPEEISAALEIQPTMTWRKGDLRKNTIIKETENGWELKSSLSLSDTIEDHIRHLLSIIESQEDKFVTYLEQCEGELSCAIYCRKLEEKYNPGIHLDRDILKRVAKFGISIDFDIYFLE